MHLAIVRAIIIWLFGITCVFFFFFLLQIFLHITIVPFERQLDLAPRLSQEVRDAERGQIGDLKKKCLRILFSLFFQISSLFFLCNLCTNVIEKIWKIRDNRVDRISRWLLQFISRLRFDRTPRDYGTTFLVFNWWKKKKKLCCWFFIVVWNTNLWWCVCLWCNISLQKKKKIINGWRTNLENNEKFTASNWSEQKRRKSKEKKEKRTFGSILSIRKCWKFVLFRGFWVPFCKNVFFYVWAHMQRKKRHKILSCERLMIVNTCCEWSCNFACTMAWWYQIE